MGWGSVGGGKELGAGPIDKQSRSCDLFTAVCYVEARGGEEKPSDMATGSRHNGALSIFSEWLVGLSGRFPPVFKSAIRSNP